MIRYISVLNYNTLDELKENARKYLKTKFLINDKN